MAEELPWEILTSPSPTLVYVERKKLQFRIETEIALALLRTSSVDAAFLRFPELAPLFVDYWRYWKPSDFDRSGGIDTATAAGLSRAIPDAFGLLDNLIGELDQYRKFGTILAIVSNYGEKSPSARFRTNYYISPDSLIEMTGFQDVILGDTSGSTAYFRLSPDDPNIADFDEFASLISEAQWSNPSEGEHSSNNRTRKIFSVSRQADRLDVSLTSSSDLTSDSTLEIGEWSGTLSDIIEPPGARSAVLNASGLYFLEGYPFGKMIRSTNANPVDILPTILHAMGIGISGELNGRILDNLYDTGWFADNPIEYVDSYEAPEPEEGEFGNESTVPDESIQESISGEDEGKILRPMSIRI
ncbi:MAG: hypothetical protein ABIC40_02275 [bacterium]